MDTKELATRILQLTTKYEPVEDLLSWEDFLDDLFEIIEEVLTDAEICEVLNG